MAAEQKQTFVGRQREMGLLVSALDETLAGRGQMVMLAGEPGIGKTSTARELADYAKGKGAQVLWGWCYEGDGAPSYWPWTHAIDSYVEHLDADQLSPLLSGNARLAEIVPQIRQRLPELPTPPVLEPDQARFQLFDSVATFLKNAAASGPLLIVLEDLHWADRASLMLLEFVINEGSSSSLMFLGTYRDFEVGRRHPLFQTLAELTRGPNFQRFHLSSFSPEDVARFVESRATIPLDALDLELVHKRTGGNPFFLNEIMRLHEEEGFTDTEAWKTGLPEGIRDVIGRRLNRLSERCNEALSMASVIGPEFGFIQLKPLMEDVTGEQLLEYIEEALTARVIEELPGASGRYQFAHALIQETLNEELSMTGRVRLHARIAETMETLYGADAESHAAELAHHYAQGAIIAGTEKMVLYSRLAGDRALAVHAYDEAQNFYQRGLMAIDVPLSGTEPIEDADAASLLFGLGRTLATISTPHENQEVLDNLFRAFDYYERVGDVPSALAIAEYPHYSMLEYETTAVLVTRALALAPEDSHGAGRLLASHGQIMGLVRGDYDAAREALSRALAIARREEDTTLELRTLAISVSVDNYHFHWSESIERIPAVVQMARQADDIHAEVNAHYFATTALASTGDLELASDHALAMLRPAERLQHRYWWTGALWKNMVVARLKGDWQVAREFGNRALEIDSEDYRLLGDWIMLEYELGEFQKGEAYLERLIAHINRTAPGPNMTYAYTATFTGFVSYITGAGNRAETSKQTAEVVLASPFSNPNIASRARVALSLLAVQAGDGESAGEQYSYLSSLRGTLLWFTISADRLLGLLAHTMVVPDQAIAHFEDALTFCRKSGYRPELAWACLDYAGTLLERNGDGDNAKAISLLDESMAISSVLGMRPLTERVVAYQERAESQMVSAPAHPDGLTQREVEVLQLVALGKTDREIGEELFISVKTVGNHVGNILNKTDSANRTEAASYATHRGLTNRPE